MRFSKVPKLRLHLKVPKKLVVLDKKGVFTDGSERLAFDAVHFIKLLLVSLLKMLILLQNKAAGICVLR